MLLFLWGGRLRGGLSRGVRQPVAQGRWQPPTCSNFKGCRIGAGPPGIRSCIAAAARCPNGMPAA